MPPSRVYVQEVLIQSSFTNNHLVCDWPRLIDITPSLVHTLPDSSLTHSLGAPVNGSMISSTISSSSNVGAQKDPITTGTAELLYDL